MKKEKSTIKKNAGFVFFTEHPYSFNTAGAAALSSSHLRMISSLGLFEKITIIYINKNSEFWKESPDNAMQSEMILRNICLNNPILFRKMDIEGLFKQLFKSKNLERLSKLIYNYSENYQLFRLLQEIIIEESPTYIWAEHLQPILLLRQIDTGNSKIIYSHHDYLFKILTIKRKLFKDRIRSFFMKKLETLVIKNIDFFVSGSMAEIDSAKKVMHNSSQLFCPCIYPSSGCVRIDEVMIKNPVRIIHFGTIAATANKLGLNNLFKNILPSINHLDFELHFVGNVEAYIVKHFTSEIQNPKIFFHGFVENLSGFFRPYDIHIIPYKGLTGTRTRVGLISNYHPCIVGYTNLLDNYPFLETNKNSLIASSDEEFIALLIFAIKNKEIRTSIGNMLDSGMENFELKLKNDLLASLELL